MKTSTNRNNPAVAMNDRKMLMSRRQMLRTLGLSGGALLSLGALGPKLGFGQEAPHPGGAGSLYIEAFPTSPLILEPFKDELPVPAPMKPLTDSELFNRWSIMPQQGYQDCDQGFHQVWPSALKLPAPLIYDIKLQVAEHNFTSSKVLPIDINGNPVTPPPGAPVSVSGDGTTQLPASTIYGFNGTFPGPMIYARYGQPVLIRFQNHLGNDNGLDRCNFGDPECKFLTHLHNAHTAPESDGNPNYREGGYWPSYDGAPGQWCDNLYLNYPAGGDDREKQSFFWFHDHTHGFTGANVYKGMVGLYPIYDPQKDSGDETKGYRLPGVPKYLGGKPANGIDYNERIEYDIPLALYDCRLDDGITQHKDAHGGIGETHPEYWGKTFFKHLPNHGFVGDVFTVNCTAYPVLEVKRRRYRLRFLDASIARCYELKLMSSTNGPVPASQTFTVAGIQRNGAGLQGQYQLPDGVQSMVFTQVAQDGGLLPFPIVRDSIELWPANRREVIVDFSKYMDGTPTTKGDVLYLVNTMKMANGRKPNFEATTTDDAGNIIPDPEFDPSYAVPVMKIVIGDDAPDNSVDPLDYKNRSNGKATLKQVKDTRTGLLAPSLKMRDLPSVPNNLKGVPMRTFELQRGGTYGGEIEWLINGHAFDRSDPNGMFPQAITTQGRAELWVIRNGGGGWTHPMHLHMEEHRVISRDKRGGLRVDDAARSDVVNLDPSEEVMIYRNFRSFKGRYVAHCHNLAHEDHAMMFGFEIA